MYHILKKDAEKSKKKIDTKSKSKNKQNSNIKELKHTIAEKEEKYLRLLAEFDNYKKRKNVEIDNSNIKSLKKYN